MLNNNIKEIPKYQKRKESNTSKINKKSNHKHKYEECLIQYSYKNSEEKVTKIKSYCIVCGKLNEMLKNSIAYNKDEKYPQEYLFKHTSEEIYENFKDKMPIFQIKNWTQNFVNLENKKDPI